MRIPVEHGMLTSSKISGMSSLSSSSESSGSSTSSSSPDSLILSSFTDSYSSIMFSNSRISGFSNSTPSSFSIFTIDVDFTVSIFVSLLAILMETTACVMTFSIFPPWIVIAFTVLLTETFEIFEPEFPSSLIPSALTSADATEADPSRTTRTLAFPAAKD